MRNFIVITALCFVYFLSVKADLTVYFEDIDEGSLNTEYVSDYESEVNDDGQSFSCHFTIIKNFPDDLYGRLYLMGLSMGEYVVETGIDYTMPFCEMFDEPIILGRIMRMFGFSPDECPPKSGKFGNDYFTLDMETLPTEFKSNGYMAVFQVKDSNDTVYFEPTIYLRVMS